MANARPSRKEDPNGPKRALSAYMFFSQNWRDRIKAENPGVGFGEIGKLLGAKWKELSEEERKPYVEMAAKDKARAEAELDAYNKSRWSSFNMPSRTPASVQTTHRRALLAGVRPELFPRTNQSPTLPSKTRSPATSQPIRSPATSQPTRSLATSQPTRSPATSQRTRSLNPAKPTRSLATSQPTRAPAATQPRPSIVVKIEETPDVANIPFKLVPLTPRVKLRIWQTTTSSTSFDFVDERDKHITIAGVIVDSGVNGKRLQTSREAIIRPLVASGAIDVDEKLFERPDEQIYVVANSLVRVLNIRGDLGDPDGVEEFEVNVTVSSPRTSTQMKKSFAVSLG
ncbi:hypothetical protein H0H92_000832 [Tricholoma furcatifolium]|nr:hypothetical protein H0H92_000832 [Tricholoma furcatifolium]